MNKIINKLLLNGDKFMWELHLKQPGFTYGACWPFTKHRETIQKFRETCNLKHLYRNQLTELGASVNKQLPEEWHKPVTKKFKRGKVYARHKAIFGQQI